MATNKNRSSSASQRPSVSVKTKKSVKKVSKKNNVKHHASSVKKTGSKKVRSKGSPTIPKVQAIGSEPLGNALHSRRAQEPMVLDRAAMPRAAARPQMARVATQNNEALVTSVTRPHMKTNEVYKMRTNVMSRPMSRGQFLRGAGVAAVGAGAALAGRGRFGARGVRAVSKAVNVATALPILAYANNGPNQLPGVPSSFSTIEAEGGVPLNFLGGSTGTFEGVHNGTQLVCSGLSMQSAGGLEKDLFWHQPSMGMTPEGMFDWLYNHGGLDLRRDIIENDLGKNVHVIPYRINTGESGGWFDERIPNDINSFNGSGLKWRVSGPLLVGIMTEAFPDVQTITTAAGFADVERLEFPTSNPDYLNGVEFHIPATDWQVLQGLRIVGPDPQTGKTRWTYTDCWWSGASVFELWINKDYWNSFTAAQRVSFEAACKQNILDQLEVVRERNFEVIREYRAAGAKVLKAWPVRILKHLEDVTQQKFMEWSYVNGEQTAFGEVLQSMNNYLYNGGY